MSRGRKAAPCTATRRGQRCSGIHVGSPTRHLALGVPGEPLGQLIWHDLDADPHERALRARVAIALGYLDCDARRNFGSEPYLDGLVSGEGNIFSGQIVSLAIAAGVSIDWLIRGSAEPPCVQCEARAQKKQPRVLERVTRRGVA